MRIVCWQRIPADDSHEVSFLISFVLQNLSSAEVVIGVLRVKIHQQMKKQTTFVMNGGKSFRMFLLQVNMSEMMGDRAQTMSSQGLQNLAKSLENSTGTSWGGSEFCKYKTIPLLTSFYN